MANYKDRVVSKEDQIWNPSSAQSSLLVNATTVSISQNVTVTSKGYAMCVATS